MADSAIVIGSNDPALSRAIRDGLPIGWGLRVADEAPDIAGVQAALYSFLPQLLLLDARIWSPGSRLVLRGASFETRVLVLADIVDSKSIAQAIAAEFHGCLPRAATAAQRYEAILGVLRGEIWMPRGLLMGALQQALCSSSRSIRVPVPDGKALTEREREVIQCVASGMTNKEIARELGISCATVKTHLHHVFGKVRVGRRVMLLPGSVVRQ